MADIVHFAEAKADMSGDARDWSVLDMLKALVRSIEAGDIETEQMCIHFWEKIEEEGGPGRSHSSFLAGMTFTDHLALLSVASHETILRYRGE